jgi:hypothetical protein
MTLPIYRPAPAREKVFPIRTNGPASSVICICIGAGPVGIAGGADPGNNSGACCAAIHCGMPSSHTNVSGSICPLAMSDCIACNSTGPRCAPATL